MNIKSRINEISYHLKNNEPTEQYCSLYLGKSGQILFEYLNQLHSQSNIEIDIEPILNNIGESKSINFSFCSGISGSVWLINYLNSKGVITIHEDFLDEIYPAIAVTANNYLDNSLYDFMHGAGGMMLALLKDVNKNRKYLEFLTRKLLNIRIKYNGHNVWQYKISNVVKKFEISLGLSHGLPSMMVLLSKLHVNDILRQECIEAINDCYSFLHKYRNYNITDTNYSYYPTMINETDEIQYIARMAWCYGDLGIASALYNVGDLIGNPAMTEEAVKLFEYYIPFNLTEKNYGVIDASFCHGSAGLAHLYYRMYFNTNNEKFKLTANYWMEIAMKMAVHNNADLNYKFFFGEEGWKNDNSLINGITGIGTALATCYYGLIPDWDECFLLS